MTREASTDLPTKTSYVVRFAGDSGDGIQLQGQQFTIASALGGHDLSTLPDFPAEIRAPTGTRYGVSAFQIQFGGDRITTPGDAPDVLIAFNPAALIVNLSHLSDGATIIVDENAFTTQRLKRADLALNPLEDGSLDRFNLVQVPVSELTQAAVKPHGLGAKDSLRCKNFWALGLILWLFDQPRDPSQQWIRIKFAADEQVRDANLAALNAGHAYGETMELSHNVGQHPTPRASLASAEYRTLTGAEALALGLVAAGELADVELMFCSYPITPASSLLHQLAGLEDAGVATFQAEDEIAAICSAIGASYGGAAGDRQFATRRSVYRHADQDRAIGSLPGRVRPQWRYTDPCGGCQFTGRLFRRCDRSGAHRTQAHDTGHPADRRLYRQRL
jgi:2-oxoglutarate ferredoxin oxidoreductase subunit alpha